MSKNLRMLAIFAAIISGAAFGLYLAVGR